MKISDKKIIEETMVRIEVLENFIQNIERAASYLRQERKYESIDFGNLRDKLIDKELDEWRHLFMWGLVVDQKTRDRVKAAAYNRFLGKDMAVSHWINNGVTPSSWLASSEDEFREMTKKLFESKKE